MDYLAEIAKTQLPFAPVKLPNAKRLFDVFSSALLILLFSPFIILIVIFSLLEQIFFPQSRGPLLYSETRISKGLPFKIYKFRIFKTVASQNYFNEHGFIQTKALESDSKNLTFTGKILKQIYMDELPQLYNVLIGEMTLVGPRPSNEVVTWQDGQNGFFQRYLFTCGITGSFQAQKGREQTLDQNKTDIEYILFCKNNPGWKVVLYDCRILLKTILTVLMARGV